MATPKAEEKEPSTMSSMPRVLEQPVSSREQLVSSRDQPMSPLGHSNKLQSLKFYLSTVVQLQASAEHVQRMRAQQMQQRILGLVSQGLQVQEGGTPTKAK